MHKAAVFVKIKRMSVIRKAQIEKELAELHDVLQCQQNKGDNAASWQERFPNLSPRQLYDSLAANTRDIGKPKIKITFLSHYAAMKIDLCDYTVDLTVLPQYLILGNIQLPAKLQNHQHGTKILHWIAQTARCTGKSNIELSASHQNGAYSWARFGFVPYVDETSKPDTKYNVDDWNGLKYQLQHFRLNADCTRISYANKEMVSNRSDYRESQYADAFAEGFALTPRETMIVKKILDPSTLESKTPESLWLISDLGRELGLFTDPVTGVSHTVTVGKALLCGLAWEGSLNLEPGSPGYNRFTSYISRSPEQAALQARRA